MIWPKRKARVSFWQQAFQLKLIRGHLRLSNFRFHRKLLRLYPAAVLHRLKLNFDVMVKDVWQGAKSVKWNDQETDHQVPMNFLFLKFKKKIYSSHKIKNISKREISNQKRFKCHFVIVTIHQQWPRQRHTVLQIHFSKILSTWF